MSKQNPQRLTTAFLNNLKPNPANAKSTDYEVNLSAMKDSGLPTGVRCLVGKSGNKRFLLRYISPITGKKVSIGLGKHPETDLSTLRKMSKEYRQQILEGVDPKIERSHLASARDMWLKEIDLVSIHTEQTLNLEWDFKRCPRNSRMVKARHPISGEMIGHLSFDTVPWNTVDEGLDARTYFDEWRVNNCLKTMEDWDN